MARVSSATRGLVVGAGRNSMVASPVEAVGLAAQSAMRKSEGLFNIGNALSNESATIGANLSEAARAAAIALNEKQKIIDVNDASSVHTQYKMGLMDVANEIQKTYRTNPVEAEDAFSKQASALGDSYSGRLSSGRAKALFDKMKMETTSAHAIDMKNWSQTQQTNNAIMSFSQDMAGIASQAAAVKSPKELNDLFNSIAERTQSALPVIGNKAIEEGIKWGIIAAKNSINGKMIDQPVTTASWIRSRVYDGVLDADTQMAFLKEAETRTKSLQEEMDFNNLVVLAGGRADIVSTLETNPQAAFLQVENEAAAYEKILGTTTDPKVYETTKNALASMRNIQQSLLNTMDHKLVEDVFVKNDLQSEYLANIQPDENKEPIGMLEDFSRFELKLSKARLEGKINQNTYTSYYAKIHAKYLKLVLNKGQYDRAGIFSLFNDNAFVNGFQEIRSRCGDIADINESTRLLHQVDAIDKYVTLYDQAAGSGLTADQIDTTALATAAFENTAVKYMPEVRHIAKDAYTPALDDKGRVLEVARNGEIRIPDKPIDKLSIPDIPKKKGKEAGIFNRLSVGW
jgi:predicted transcriptional regulator